MYTKIGSSSICFLLIKYLWMIHIIKDSSFACTGYFKSYVNERMLEKQFWLSCWYLKFINDAQTSIGITLWTYNFKCSKTNYIKINAWLMVQQQKVHRQFRAVRRSENPGGRGGGTVCWNMVLCGHFLGIKF